MYCVVSTSDGLMIEAPLYARGRQPATWTPSRRLLTDGSAARYGCRCQHSALVPDSALLADIRKGVTTRVEAAFRYDR